MITDIFNYEFMRHALWAGIAVAIAAPIIGSFILVRRYALVADTLAHISLAGIAVGILAGLNPIGSALVIAVGAGILIELLRTKKNIGGEAILALFLSGGLAIAIVLLSIARQVHSVVSVDITSYIFGSITTVTTQDLWIILASTVFILISVGLFYKELFALVFDEDIAHAQGLPTTMLNLLLITLTALTVAAAIRTVGALLIEALMVIPHLAAAQFHRSFKHTISLSIVFSLAATISGLIISYIFDLPSGGVIVLCTLILFIASTIWNRSIHYTH